MKTNETPETPVPASKWPQVRIDPKVEAKIDALCRVIAINRSQAIQMALNIGADAIQQAYASSLAKASKKATKEVNKVHINLADTE